MALLLRFILGVIGVIAVYVILSTLNKVYEILRECFILFNIASGGGDNRRSTSKWSRLHVYVCKTKLLDELSVKEIFQFYCTMIDTDATVAQFQKVMLSYKFIILYREKVDGSLRGAMLLDIRDKDTKQGKIQLSRLGLVFMHRQYRGGGLLYLIAPCLVLKEMFLHPFTPMYVIGKTYSHKSYMIAAQLFPDHCFPRYNAETPEFEQSLLHEYAESVKMPGDVYRPETGVMREKCPKSNIPLHRLLIKILKIHT